MAENRWEALLRRVRAMHVLWDRAVADMTTEQVNHHERPGVLPMTFSLFHFVQGEDRAIAERILNEPLIWNADWSARTGIEAESLKRGTPIAVAEQVRLRDLGAWRDYQRAVFARTETALAAMPDARWEEILYPQVPEALAGGFISLLAGSGPVRLGDLMDVFIYQHGMRHLGEIEHGRALVGLGGVS